MSRYGRDTLGFVVFGVCAVLAYEARTAGIALLVAWVVDHALRKETRRALTALVVSALLVASWTSWIQAVESSPEYPDLDAPLDWLVKPSPYERFTAPLLAANPDAWRRVWRGANGTLDLYERVGPPRP